MTSIIVIMLTSACISEVATASRQLWSFARACSLDCHPLNVMRHLLTVILDTVR